MGTVFQSQTGTDEAAWGTKALDSTLVYEAYDLLTDSHVQEVRPNKPFKSSSVRYKLGMHGKKSITFYKNKIKVEVIHPGDFDELVPLLISEGDSYTKNDGRIKILTSKGSFAINTSGDNDIEIKNFEADLREKDCKVITISGRNKLTYEFILE